jgi:glycogen(starch) synthase
MNIALFASAFHPHFGGVEELVRQLAHELQRRGHGVIILTNRWPRSLPSSEIFEGIPVYRLPFRTSEQSLKSKITYRLTHERVVARTLRILDQHAIDVVHVQCVSSNADYALRARALQPRPLVVTMQGELTMDASRLFERSENARATLRRALREAEIITGCSTKTIRDAEVFLGEPLPEARTIFNAANLEDFANAKPWIHPGPYVFALGRLVPQKAFDLLIESFADAALPTHDLLIAGDGVESERLEEIIHRRGLVGHVHLLGRANRPKVASLFLGCSFFALPSRADEGLPVVCAEAMAAGKAVVAARAGGAPEAVLDGKTGIIFEKEDRAGLAAGLRRLGGNPMLRDRYGAVGAKRSEQFSWPLITDQYVAAYRAAAEKAGTTLHAEEVLLHD